MCLSFTACSDDDGDNGVTITKEQVVGTWDVVWAEQDGESVDIPEGYVYMRLNDDGHIELLCSQIIMLVLIQSTEVQLLV